MESVFDQLFKRSPLTVVNEAYGVLSWSRLGIISVDILPDASTATQPVSLPGYTDQELSMAGAAVDSKNAKIIQPTRLVIKGITKDVTVVESIMADFDDVTSTFTVTSKGIISDAMAIIDLGIDFSPHNTDSYLLTIQMEQAERKVLTGFDPEQPSDDSTYGVRVQLPTTSIFEQSVDSALAQADSLASNFTSSVTGLYNKVQNVIKGVT